MKKKNNKRPPTRESRRVFDTVRRPLTRQAARKWFESRARNGRLYNRPLLSLTHSQRLRVQRKLARKKSLFGRLAYVTGRVLSDPRRVLDRDCRRQWRKILSWRADQKGKGKGGRQRKPRSQREKVKSEFKHLKDC